MQLEESHAPYFENHPPWRGPESKEDEEALLDFNLEAPQELGLEVDCFLQGQAERSGEEDGRMSSSEPSVEELESWVTWRAWMHDMPGWWQELAEVPGVDDHKKLAQEVWASLNSHGGSVNDTVLRITIRPHKHCHAFIGRVSCHCLTPICLPRHQGTAVGEDGGLCQSHPVLGGKSQSAYSGKPCLLAGNIMELREEMKCYVSFTDEDVFSGVALLEETSTTQPQEATPESAQPTQANSPSKVTEEPTKKEKPPNQFPGCNEVLHPSKLVATAKQIPPIKRP